MWCAALLYIVPAKVEGIWRLADGELTLTQSFQMISGTLNTGGRTMAIENGRLRGDQIQFRAGGVDYSGQVSPNAITGEMKGRGTGTWSATRAPQ